MTRTGFCFVTCCQILNNLSANLSIQTLKYSIDSLPNPGQGVAKHGQRGEPFWLFFTVSTDFVGRARLLRASHQRARDRVRRGARQEARSREANVSQKPRALHRLLEAAERAGPHPLAGALLRAVPALRHRQALHRHARPARLDAARSLQVLRRGHQRKTARREEASQRMPQRKKPKCHGELNGTQLAIPVY